MNEIKQIILSNGLGYEQIKKFCRYMRDKREYLNGPRRRTFYSPWRR